MVVVKSNVLEPSRSIDLIPKGENEAKRAYGDWQFENKNRVDKAMAEYNAAKQAAFDKVPQEKKDRVEELRKELGDHVRFSVAQKEKSEETRDLTTSASQPIEAAKIQRVSDNLIQLSKKVSKANSTKGFVTELSNAIGAKGDASKYASFILNDGSEMNVRISNHNAKAENFDNGNNLSIVIKRRQSPNTFNANHNVDLIEYVYFKDNLSGEDMSSICQSLVEALQSGQYEDKTGKAKVNMSGNPRFSISKADDAAYMDAVERGDMETAQRMVDEAAAKAGYTANDEYKDSHHAPAASVDRKDFTNLDALREVVENDSADSNLFAIAQGVSTQPDDYFSRNGARWYGYDDAEGMESYRNLIQAIKEINRQVEEYEEVRDMPTIKVYRAVPKEIKGRQLESGGQWVSPSRLYAKGHGQHRFGYGKYQIVEQEARADELWWDGNNINEWGFDDDTSNVYKNTKNNRKLLDPVTYDDQGNVIPLSKRFNPRSADIRFSVVNSNQAVFVSNAEKAVGGIRQEKATPEQWLKMIEKSGGLKAGEDKWLGLSEWLKSQTAKTLTKQQVLDFIKENMIQIEEVKYGGELFNINSKTNLESDIARAREEGESDESVLQLWDRLYGMGLMDAYRNGDFTIDENGKVVIGDEIMQPINSTRLGYTTRGIDNKREIVLTVPAVEPWNEGDEIHFGDAGGGRAVAWVRFGETNDKDGNRVLVIDEIQSKRHQEGRESGYVSTLHNRRVNELGMKLSWGMTLSDSEADEIEALMQRPYSDTELHIKPEETWLEITEDKYQYHTIFAGKTYDVGKGVVDSNEQAAKYLAQVITREVREHNDHLKEGVPDAPFEKNWHELAMKRMLRLAAEEGYDKVAWTTGEQQAARYDLSKELDKLSIRKNADGTYNVEGIRKGSNELERFESNVPEENLAGVVGKDIAKQAIEYNGIRFELEGDGMLIGGEGMKGFYDKMLPSFMNKYGKQWGVKVGEVTLPNVEEAGRTMWAVDVTDAMKESVMQGQVMFSIKKSEGNLEDRQLSLFLQNNSGEYETQDGQTIGFASLLNGTDSNMLSGRGDGVQRRDDSEPTDFRLRKLEDGETCHVERRYQETKQFDFTGSEKIESIDDVAYIFRKLEDAAVENAFVVLVKDGKPTIIHVGIGGYAFSPVSTGSPMVAYKNINPDKVYFVHNHPSGNLVCSQQDIDVYKKFKTAFGDKLQPGIIIDTTSGKYGIFTDASNEERDIANNVPDAIPMKVYAFSKQVFEPNWNPQTAFRATSPQDVAKFVSSHRLGKHEKMSLLVLNNNGNIVGNVFLPYTDINEAIKDNNLANEIGYYAHQMAGTVAIIYGDFRMSSAGEITLRNLKSDLFKQEISLQDCIYINGYGTEMSAKMSGRLYEPAAMYGELADEERRDILKDETMDAEQEANDPVLYSITGKPSLKEITTEYLLTLAEQNKSNLRLQGDAIHAFNVMGNLTLKF